ncbi:MAG: hypothetical protein K2H82_11200, partial [Oscillospiraceae bacterium]|nr:hypothetical protein [Oscillospiraceae bacterium]
GDPMPESEEKQEPEQKIQKNPDEKNKPMTVRLIDGKWANHVNRELIIGYCNYKLHPGALTEQLLKSHACMQKKCPYLKRLQDRKFWKDRQDKQEHKKNIRQAKQVQEQLSQDLLAEARRLALTYHVAPEIEIMQVMFDAERNFYKIFYISDKPWDDHCNYLDFLHAYCYMKSAGAEIRHIRDINGNYVTRADKKCYQK